MEDLDSATPEQLLAMLQVLESSGKLNDAPPELKTLLNRVKQEKGERVDEDPRQEVVPEPGFVVKTSDISGAKVFVNMTGSTAVDAPGNWEGGKMPEDVENALANVDNLDAQQGDTLRFPLSLGPLRRDLDKKGEPCMTFDVILNLDVIKQAQAYRQLKVFLIELALSWIDHRHQLQLDKKFKLPKMKYKGEMVQSQHIRVKRKALVTELEDRLEDNPPTFPLLTRKLPPPAEGSKTAPGSRAGVGGDATTVMGDRSAAASSAAAPPASSAAASSAAAAPSQGAAGDAGAHAGPSSLLRHSLDFEGRPVAALRLCVDLPPGCSAQEQDMRVEVGWNDVQVSVPRCAPLQVKLPFGVDMDSATVDLQDSRLVVLLPYRSLSDLVADMEKHRPYTFGAVSLANRDYLELET